MRSLERSNTIPLQRKEAFKLPFTNHELSFRRLEGNGNDPDAPASAPTTAAAPDEPAKLDFREYGTALAMQRTTMAFVRTAVSVSGLGRTSASARVQYTWCALASRSGDLWIMPRPASPCLLAPR